MHSTVKSAWEVRQNKECVERSCCFTVYKTVRRQLIFFVFQIVAFLGLHSRPERAHKVAIQFYGNESWSFRKPEKVPENASHIGKKETGLPVVSEKSIESNFGSKKVSTAGKGKKVVFPGLFHGRKSGPTVTTWFCWPFRGFFVGKIWDVKRPLEIMVWRYPKTANNSIVKKSPAVLSGWGLFFSVIQTNVRSFEFITMLH